MVLSPAADVVDIILKPDTELGHCRTAKTFLLILEQIRQLSMADRVALATVELQRQYVDISTNPIRIIHQTYHTSRADGPPSHTNQQYLYQTDSHLVPRL